MLRRQYRRMCVGRGDKKKNATRLWLSTWIMFFVMLAPICYGGDHPTAEEILRRADDMLLHDTSVATLRMILHLPRGVIREKEIVAYTRGRDTAFMEVTAPARDRGTKYLKIGRSMWVFFPRARRTILIKGHMLRQGMMGSDFSYEDALESNSLLEDYSAKLLASEQWKDLDCYKLELMAQRDGLTFYRRLVWVDKSTYVPVHNQLFAKSGRLLKTFDMGSIEKIGARYYPTEWTMRDELREDTKTIMRVTKIEFDVPIDDEVFSRRNLER